MAKTKAQKQEALAVLQDKFAKAKTVVFVDYTGSSVEAITGLRQNAKDSGSEYLVAKKTLVSKAAQEQGVEGYDADSLHGNLGVLFGYEDEVSPAKLAKDFTKQVESFNILAGVMEGSFIQADAVNQLASLPSKEELLAKLVGSLNSPLSGLVGVLNGVQREFVQVLSAVADKKQ